MNSIPVSVKANIKNPERKTNDPEAAEHLFCGFHIFHFSAQTETVKGEVYVEK